MMTLEEQGIYGVPVEDLIGNVLREIAEVRKLVAALRDELVARHVPTQPDAAFPQRALRWSV
jgi:hypothetical protein